MPKPGGCSSSNVGGSGGGGSSGGDAKDLPQLLLRVGAAVTLSVAGLLFSRRQRPPRQLRLPPPPPPSESDDAPSMKARTGLKELRILKNEDTRAKIISGNSVHTTTTTTTTTTTALVPLAPKCRSIDDDEGYLLPEFNEMVLKEFGRDIDTIPTTPAARVREDVSNDHEIHKLRDLVRSLQEREKTLELQLMECYGLQEQDAAVRELENQLNINNVQSKLYLSKVESLQSENQKLQTQLSENTKIISELEATRAKCKLLKKKLTLDAEQAKEKMTSLQKMVDSLQRKETDEENNHVEVEKKLKRLEELEKEATELRAANSRLQQENAHLIRRLELTRLPPVPKPKSSMEVKASEEADQLKQENEKLTKEIEQLQSDRFADVEELVYLKWINACLRYELRNKDTPSGKTVARDLSMTLSPKSELKAKQLIMEYAGAEDSHLGHVEFGSECSSSWASSGEPDDISIDIASMTKHKSPKKKQKFFSKLRKLVLGKGKENREVSPQVSTLERRVSISSCSFDDFTGRDSHDSYSSFMADPNGSDSRRHGGAHSSLYSVKSSPVGAEIGNERSDHSGVNSVSSREERVNAFGHSAHLDSGKAIPEDAELHKFADALITSRSGSISTSSRRSSSFRH